MKNILLTATIILFLLSLSSSLPDDPIRRSNLTATNTLKTDLYFVWRNDTIDFSNLVSSFGVLKSDSTVIFTTPTQVENLILASAGGHDPLTLGDSAIAKGFSLNVQELEFDYSYFLFKDIYDLNNDSIVDNSKKLDGSSLSNTPYGVTWANSDSIPKQKDIYNKIQSMEGTVYQINLPVADKVGTRCSAAVEGTDYPTGWTVEAGTSAVDLKITHNLGRRVMSVSVFSVSGTQERQLIGTSAYSGILTETGNILRIESLATVNKAIVIYILFV